MFSAFFIQTLTASGTHVTILWNEVAQARRPKRTVVRQSAVDRAGDRQVVGSSGCKAPRYDTLSAPAQDTVTEGGVLSATRACRRTLSAKRSHLAAQRRSNGIGVGTVGADNVQHEYRASLLLFHHPGDHAAAPTHAPGEAWRCLDPGDQVAGSGVAAVEMAVVKHSRIAKVRPFPHVDRW